MFYVCIYKLTFAFRNHSTHFVFKTKIYRFKFQKEFETWLLGIYPDNMNILAQRWLPIGDIGVGVLLSHWLNIGFPLALLALEITCQKILFQYWLAIGTCDIGFISAPNNSMVLVQHTGNRPATNIEPIVGIFWLNIGLRLIICLKIAGWVNNKMIYKNTRITQWRLFLNKHIISIIVYHIITVSIKKNTFWLAQII